MIRTAFFLAICLAASSTIALADEACPPITNLVSAGMVTYTAYPCAPISLVDSQLRCGNCPSSQVFQPLKSQQAMCFRAEPNYIPVTVYRHLKNGKCVPVVGSLDRKRTVPKQIPALAGPLAPAAPPRVAPVQAPPAMHAPPAVAPRAPLAISAPARVEIAPRISAAPSRPQPAKP